MADAKVRAIGFEAGLATLALVAGLILARWPVLPLVVGLSAGAVILAILAEPLVGLGLTLIAAPFVALERFTWNLPLDVGQALLMVTLGAWLLRGLARRAVYLLSPVGGRGPRGESLPAAPLLLPLLIFVGVTGLSLWNAFSVEAGLSELLKWVEVIAVYLFVVETVDSKKLPWVIGGVLLAALVQAGIGVWQFGLRGYGPEHFLIPGKTFYRAYGSFEQPNPFAGYIGLNLPLAVGVLSANFRLPLTPRHLRGVAVVVLLLATCALLTGALVASWSRGAWLGAAAAMAVMAAFWPRRWWLGVGAISLVAVAVVGGNALGVLPAAIRARLTDFTQYTRVYDVRGVGVNDANYAVIERLAHWQAAGEMIRWQPWTGVGLGSYEAAYESYRLLRWPYALGHAHNLLLNLTAETGLPGLLAYVALWAIIVGQTIRAVGRTSGWQRGLALGLLGVWVHLHAHNMFDNLYVSNLWIHLAVLLGMLTVVGRQASSVTPHAYRVSTSRVFPWSLGFTSRR